MPITDCPLLNLLNQSFNFLCPILLIFVIHLITQKLCTVTNNPFSEDLVQEGNRELAVATGNQFLSDARGNGGRGGLRDTVVGDGGVEVWE
jgi:hypothetical protein